MSLTAWIPVVIAVLEIVKNELDDKSFHNSQNYEMT